MEVKGASIYWCYNDVIKRSILPFYRKAKENGKMIFLMVLLLIVVVATS